MKDIVVKLRGTEDECSAATVYRYMARLGQSPQVKPYRPSSVPRRKIRRLFRIIDKAMKKDNELTARELVNIAAKHRIRVGRISGENNDSFFLSG